MSSYEDGYMLGAREAREVLVMPGTEPWQRHDLHLPVAVSERAHWLNGYSAGIRYVAFQVAMGNLHQAVQTKAGNPPLTPDNPPPIMGV